MTRYKKQLLPVRAIIEGEMVSTDLYVIEYKLGEYYKKVFKANENDPQIGRTNNENLIDDLFTTEDIKLAIEKCNFNKAIGSDMASGDLLKNPKIKDAIIEDLK